MEFLGGEVDLEVDGFEVLVKVKGLGGAGALREPMDSNSSFPVILTPSIVLATVETLRYMLDFRNAIPMFVLFLLSSTMIRGRDN